MIVVVNDANILIDLVKLDLLQAFFALGFECHTTDFVLNQEIQTDQRNQINQYIQAALLKVNESTPEEMENIFELSTNNKKLSPADCSVYVLSKKLDAILLTSDGPLRKFSATEGIEVHGHLWLFDQMVEKKVITGIEAAEKLIQLIEVINPKLGLPRAECVRRILMWRE